jgi:hypothetical protein
MHIHTHTNLEHFSETTGADLLPQPPLLIHNPTWGFPLALAGCGGGCTCTGQPPAPAPTPAPTAANTAAAALTYTYTLAPLLSGVRESDRFAINWRHPYGLYCRSAPIVHHLGGGAGVQGLLGMLGMGGLL